VVNPLGVTEPMVGWKRAPFPAVTSRCLVLISVSILYPLKWELIDACMYILICNFALKRLTFVYTLFSLRTCASIFLVCPNLSLEGVFTRELPHSSEIKAILLEMLPSR
jgi:hypothetical protein